MEYLPTLILATMGGFFARWYMLDRDYRQYPSYPQGWAIHLFLGFIGAMLGAILIPSIMEKEFAAVSFLLLAASQFREVRNVERMTLKNMEPTELVTRGAAYIEGIARVFEARNYLAIWTSFTVALVSELLAFDLVVRILGAAAAGVITAGVLNHLMKGQSIKDIANVELAPIRFDGPLLLVENVTMINVV